MHRRTIGLRHLWTDRYSRVGDIVDIKANGAVQKG
jgi:hypothetical protein